MLWALFAYQSEVVYRSFVVPIEFRNLNRDFVLKDPVPLEARVTLAASEQSFRTLDPNSIIISINLENKKKGSTTFTITESYVSLPSTVNLFNVEPSSVKIQLQELVEVNLPVEVKTSGYLPGKLKLASTSSEPVSVKILIPQSDVSSIKKIFTEPVDLNLVNSSTKVITKLNIPPGYKVKSGQSDFVTVNIEVR